MGLDFGIMFLWQKKINKITITFSTFLKILLSSRVPKVILAVSINDI